MRGNPPVRFGGRPRGKGPTRAPRRAAHPTPHLLDTVIDQLRTAAPTTSTQRARGHGRTEERILHAVAATATGFPGAAQVFRIIRYTGGLDGQRTRKKVVHGITNLGADKADADRLAVLVRGHWTIEERRALGPRHHLPRGRLPRPHRQRPRLVAAIRNLVTTALRLAGATNIAAARRAASLNPRAVINLFTGQTKPGQTAAMTEPWQWGTRLRDFDFKCAAH